MRANKTKTTNKSLGIRILKVFLKSIFFLGLIVGLAGVLYVYKNLQDVPTISTSELKTDSSANMYASDGKTLIWSSAKYKRKYVNIKDVPEVYKNLLLATEDANYYNENGASIKGIANAGFSYLLSKLGHGSARGGSGIEQQLIKLSAFSTSASDVTVSRKIKELYLATQMDKNYSKSKILEFYINKIWLGENSYGAQTISYTYYGKPLKDLSVAQQAVIAGLGQSPSVYNLYTNPKLVQQRRDIVLSRGLTQKAITKSEYNKAIKTPITDGLMPRYWQNTQVQNVTKQHNAFISSALKQVSDLGYDLNKTPLQITTTLDINSENYVKNLFDTHPEYFQSGQQAATTITDPSTGDVLVQIGGINSDTIGGINRATNTNRSSGSSIKPILDYGPALENWNWATNHSIDSSPYTYPGTNITAYDYGKSAHGMTDIQTALRQSYNTAAIRALAEVGPTRAKQFITNLGVQTTQTLAGSTAISMNISSEQLAGAIGAFGQSGVYHPTRYVKSLRFSDNSVKKISFKPVQAMRASTAYVMTKMLEGVFSQKGTAPDAAINGVAMAGKTGTNGYPDDSIYAGDTMDLWTIGYTKSISMALWYGFDTPMQPGSQLNEYVGDSNKDKLYKDIMTYMNKNRDVSEWTKPNTVQQLGSGSGLDANYQATDQPLKTVTKTLNKVSMSVNNNYPTSSTSKKLKTKRPKTPEVPKNYKKGEWKKELQSEKDKFYEEHKNDLENAKKVSGNE